MSRNLILPFFPVPPEQYDQQYMEEIVRSFSTYLTQMQNPGEGRHTELVLTNLQTHDQGLEVGALFIDKDVSGYYIVDAIMSLASIQELTLPAYFPKKDIGEKCKV